MSDDLRREMQTLLVRMKTAGETQERIAAAAGVRQPLVSLAGKGKLVERTRSVERLFEYLRATAPDAPGSTEPLPVTRDLDPRLVEALMRLSDGSADGNARLVGLLKAIAAVRRGSDLE